MAITNAQQYQQLVNKPANGKRPGYRGPGGYQGGASSRSGPPGGGATAGGSGRDFSGGRDTGPSQGPAGGASAGGNYGGNVNVKQEYGGKAYEDQSYATQESIDNAKKREEVRKFQESLENDRKRRARNKRRLEEAKLNKKNLFNKLGYIQRTKDENLEDLGAIDSQGLTIGGVEVPSFISGIGSAFTIDPSTKYFDEDSIREIGSQTQYTKSIDPVTGKVTFGTTAKQADTLADLKEDIQFEDRVLSPDPDDAVSQSEFTDYMNRNKVELPDNDRANEQQDPCLGPNPPAYCNINNTTEEEDPKQILSTRILGSQFDPTFFANEGGRAGLAEGGMPYEGGIMDLESGRQMYFLGKLVKKATRAVKKIAKSPIGKAALMYFGGNALMGKMGGLGGLKGSLFGTAGGTARMTPGILGKLGLTGGGGSMGLTGLGKAALVGIPSIIPLLAGKEEDDFDIDAYYAANQLTPGTTKRQMGSEFDFYNYNLAEGGMPSKEPVAKETMPLIDMDGKEMDLRAEGGFVPIGRMEKVDDVPARLSKNEFVFTADAVRNAGEGDIDKGAEVMYNMMKNLESGGEVSEESQGLDGAREMFQTSKRLEEVL